jgi:hypothetical protein
MNHASNDAPRTIDQYLAALRAAFGDADRALQQDALSDAEEYLRGELALAQGEDEAAVLARIVRSYGAPDEVAAAYRQTEATVQRALEPRRAPSPTGAGAGAGEPRPAAGGLFGVFRDPHAYGAVFYMLLSLVTGIFYFTWTITGATMSLGFLVLIVGIPFLLLFLASVRVLALVEGRVVEGLLGVRMPRRPAYAPALPFLERIRAMLIDGRTWTALLYMLLMLPLGILYFAIAVVGAFVPLALLLAPFAALFGDLFVNNDLRYSIGPWDGPLDGIVLVVLPLVGAALLVGFMHLARGIGRMHGALAKALLVRL